MSRDVTLTLKGIEIVSEFGSRNADGVRKFKATHTDWLTDATYAGTPEAVLEQVVGDLQYLMWAEFDVMPKDTQTLLRGMRIGTKRWKAEVDK